MRPKTGKPLLSPDFLFISVGVFVFSKPPQTAEPAPPPALSSWFVLWQAQL